MHTFVVICMIDNKRTEITVKAKMSVDAKELVKAQYPNSKVTIVTAKQID